MPHPRTVAVTGASGLIGTALCRALSERGDRVLRLVRNTPTSPQERAWAPRPGGLDPRVLDDVDAVVHLAGAGVGDRRWTPAYKELLLSSRVAGTAAVAEALAAQARGGRSIRLVSGAAIGIYGDRGDEQLTESSAPGEGFLAELVRAWEGATEAAAAAGVPVATARTGLVLTPEGGAFARMLALARFGLGGPLGSGRQWWSWITLTDQVRAIGHLLDHPQITGPVNLVGPEPRRQREVAAALGAVLHRPAVLPAPAIALRIALGEFADDILGSQRVLPQVLQDNGFRFEHASLGAAVATLR